MDPIVCSISLRKLSHWIVQMPLINCNFLQFFAKTCGCLQTTLSTRLIRKLNGPENTVSVKRTYQASTIKFWFLKSMQPIGSFNNYVDIILHFFEYLSRLLCPFLSLTWTKIDIFWPPTRPILFTSFLNDPQNSRCFIYSFCHQRFQLPSRLKNKSLWKVYA